MIEPVMVRAFAKRIEAEIYLVALRTPFRFPEEDPSFPPPEGTVGHCGL